MTEKQSQPSLKVAFTSEQAATGANPIDGTTDNPRPKLTPSSTAPGPLTLPPYRFSRVEFGPQLPNALSSTKPPRLAPELGREAVVRARLGAGQLTGNEIASGGTPPPLPAPALKPEAPREPDPATVTAKPWARMGVIVACLLGAVPVIVLALVRGQGKDPDLSVATTRASGPLPAATQGEPVAAASLLGSPAIAEGELEEADVTLRPPDSPARPAAAVERNAGAKDPARPTQPFAAHSPAPSEKPAARADAPAVSLTATRTSTAVSSLSVPPCSATRVRSSWFHR